MSNSRIRIVKLVYPFVNGKGEEEKPGQITAREKYLPNLPGREYGREEANRELEYYKLPSCCNMNTHRNDPTWSLDPKEGTGKEGVKNCGCRTQTAQMITDFIHHTVKCVGSKQPGKT